MQHSFSKEMSSGYAPPDHLAYCYGCAGLSVCACVVPALSCSAAGVRTLSPAIHQKSTAEGKAVTLLQVMHVNSSSVLANSFCGLLVLHN